MDSGPALPKGASGLSALPVRVASGRVSSTPADEAQIITVKVMAYETSFTLMIEPWGMTYDLAPDEVMFVDLTIPPGQNHDAVEVVQWDGGISITGPDRATTRDGAGTVLQEF